MGNCPSCGAEMGFGVVICPSCGNQMTGDSLTDEGHHDGITGDSSGDSIDDSQGGDLGGHGERVTEPQTPEPEEFADGWVADEAIVDKPPTVDAGVLGSEIPVSHGGGFTQQGEDGTAPSDVISPPEVDAGVPGSEIPPSHGGGFQQRPPDDYSPGPSHLTSPQQLDRSPDDIPDRPDPGISIDDSSGRVPPRFNVGLGLAAILVIVIIALAGWYIWSGVDDGNGDDEPNGNGGPHEETGLHIDEDATTGQYPYEPPGEYHLSITLRNNGTETVDLEGHDLYVTVFIGMDKVGEGRTDLSGEIQTGSTRSFDIVAQTDVLGGGQELLVSIMLRKNGGNTQVDLYTYNETL